MWSTGGAAIKLSEMNAPWIAGGRALFCALTFFLLIPSARGRWTRPVMITGFFYAATCVLFVFANTLTTAGSAIFLQNIAPFWVLLLGPWMLGEKPTRMELWSLPLCLLGAALFFAEDFGLGRLSGVLCALAASVSYACLMMMYRKISTGEGHTSLVAGNVLIIVLCLPFAEVTTAPSATDVAAIVYLGAVQQGLGGLLFIRGIRRTSALEGALLVLLEPIFSPLWAYLWVAETLGPLSIAGALLIIGATLWRLLGRGRAEAPPDQAS